MKKLLFTLLLASLAITLVACGGENSSTGNDNTPSTPTSGSSSANKVVIEALNFDFDQEEYHVAAGEITIELKNSEGFHGIEIVGTGIDIKGNASQTVTLEPGEYEIICSIPCGPGHADMYAKLIVS